MRDNLPNFDQFVEFVLERDFYGGRVDNHLNFYWQKCDMCNMHYDIIGKTETSEEDLKYIFTKLEKV